MKKILTVLMMSICMTSFGQSKLNNKQKIKNLTSQIDYLWQSLQESRSEVDSLNTVALGYQATANKLFNIVMSPKSSSNNEKLQAQTLQSINDSLVAKINKMLIFHYYACQIIQAINSDGSIHSRKDLIEAVNQYHNYYKNKHE